MFTGSFNSLFEFSWKDRRAWLKMAGGGRWRVNMFTLSYCTKCRDLGVRARVASPHFFLRVSLEHPQQFIPVSPGKLFVLPIFAQFFILFSLSTSLSLPLCLSLPPPPFSRFESLFGQSKYQYNLPFILFTWNSAESHKQVIRITMVF